MLGIRDLLAPTTSYTVRVGHLVTRISTLRQMEKNFFEAITQQWVRSVIEKPKVFLWNTLLRLIVLSRFTLRYTIQWWCHKSNSANLHVMWTIWHHMKTANEQLWQLRSYGKLNPSWTNWLLSLCVWHRIGLNSFYRLAKLSFTS